LNKIADGLVYRMELVTVFSTFNTVEADLIRSQLEAAEFHAVITHELSASMLGAFAASGGGILVQVPEDEAADARELITAPGEAPTT
jgi:Putative prokaryotic signal transducing protein